MTSTPRRPRFPRTGPRRAAVLAVLAAAPTLLAPGAERDAEAGCLAPADTTIDAARALGPLWGNDEGTLLYAADATGSAPDLLLREAGASSEAVAEFGDSNEFFVGTEVERWAAFHSGTVNGAGDVAFVASTTIDDDPQTIEDESLARRGAYARRGNILRRLGRFGLDSPILDVFGGRVPWGSFFDAVALGREGADPLRVVVTAQIGAPDGRIGLFRWEEGDAEPSPLVMTGDPSPAGGAFSSIGRVRGNEAGDLFLAAQTRLSPGDPAAPGLFLFDRNGGRTRILRFGTEGDPAPGGGRFGLLADLDVDGAGGVVFCAGITGGPGGSGLFRAAPPLYQPEALLRQGDGTPLGGTFDSFTTAVVRADEDGSVGLLVPLSDDVGGSGLFTLPAGSTDLVPLVTVKSPIAAASLGGGRMAYQDERTTHAVVPADGTDEGPTDFRVVKVDLRNAVARRADSIAFDGRFRLPPWGTGAGEAPPAVFRTTGIEKTTPTATFSGTALTRVAEVRVQVSESPGQMFAFGIDDPDGSPKGRVSVYDVNTFGTESNPLSGTVSRLSVAKTGDAATWTFRTVTGPGSFSVDLARGTFRLRLSRGDVRPSFEARNFRVALTLRTAADVTGQRTGALAFFHRAVRLDADQPSFGSGRRVRSKGERLPGGTLFVDTLRIDRKLAGGAVPQGDSDKVTLSGTLRTCPGATPPVTPTIVADVAVGDLVLSSVEMKRAGRSGSRYRGASAPGAPFAWKLDLDAVKGSFSFRAVGADPISQCVDADFSGGSGPNDSRQTVGGMTVPVTVRFARVYEATYGVPVVRRPGGKVFER